jgi:hypothetical protein
MGDRLRIHGKTVRTTKTADSCTKVPTFEAVPSGISGMRQIELPRVAAK